MGKLLELNNVHSYYGHIHALKGISLYVEEGEIVSLIGSNGAGKSSTLRTISGMIHAREGSVLLDGKDITQIELHNIVSMGVGHVPEGRGIFPKLTVQENLDMGAFTINDQKIIKERMELVFELFPRLKERVSQFGGTLSGGEQQMLAIGRGLNAQPAHPHAGRTFHGACTCTSGCDLRYHRQIKQTGHHDLACGAKCFDGALRG